MSGSKNFNKNIQLHILIIRALIHHQKNLNEKWQFPQANMLHRVGWIYVSFKNHCTLIVRDMVGVMMGGWWGFQWGGGGVKWGDSWRGQCRRHTRGGVIVGRFYTWVGIHINLQDSRCAKGRSSTWVVAQQKILKMWKEDFKEGVLKGLERVSTSCWELGKECWSQNLLCWWRSPLKTRLCLFSWSTQTTQPCTPRLSSRK